MAFRDGAPPIPHLFQPSSILSSGNVAEVIALFPYWRLNNTCQPPPAAWASPEKKDFPGAEERVGPLRCTLLPSTVPSSGGRAGFALSLVG